ncbi:hypothetical protein CEXT_635501 [Caerostris extrusa]|uniref:Uncharacterized protein n=1 Tax=Caerostris extrusa TaxID=172846 RepID=A0AAV4XM92_CAEEX|nr:hypothetical protein CEXT_635501 [Caerostris extrusa]
MEGHVLPDEEEHGHNKAFQEHILSSKMAREPFRAHKDPSDNDHRWKMPNSSTICCKVAQIGVASFGTNVPSGVTEGRDSVQLERSKLRLN